MLLLAGLLALFLAVPGPAAADDLLQGEASRSALRAKTAAHSIVFTASDGQQFDLLLSNRIADTPQNIAAAMGYGQLIAGLAHGRELSLIDVYIGPFSEIEDEICGEGSLACYAPFEDTMYVPKTVPAGQPSVPEVVTHEYGHHLAGHRRNAFGRAIAMGTERWASLYSICGRVRDGSLDPDRYYSSPGELFAESYAKYHFRDMPWVDFDFEFEPGAASYEAVRRDVLEPFAGIVSSTYEGRLGPSSEARTFRIDLPNDGRVRARLAGPAGSDFDMRIRFGGKLIGTAEGADSDERWSGKACSSAGSPDDRLAVKIVRYRGRGAFSLALSHPSPD